MILSNGYAEVREINKKRIGMMKDELGNGYMTEFVVLSPKVYAFAIIHWLNIKKQKVQRKKLLKRDFALICTNSVYSRIKCLTAYKVV